MSKKILCTCLLILVAGVGCEDKSVSKNIPVVPKKDGSSIPAALPAAEQEQPKVEREIYVYNPGGRRDPFLSLIQTSKAKVERKKGISPVENYDVDEIKLIAIAWDNRQHYAMITLPDRKSYTIRKGMTLGINEGKIIKITRDAVFITEQVKDYKGQFRTKDTILKLRKEEEE